MVNGVSYKKLFENSTVYTVENSGESFVSGNWQVVELIRDDTLNRKVYIRKITESIYFPGPNNWCGVGISADSLLFDFSGLNGDSIIVHFGSANNLNGLNVICNYDSFALDSISTNYVYGANRKVWYIHGGGQFNLDNFQMLEGIGYTFGLYGMPPVYNGFYPYSTSLENYCVGPDSVCGTCYTQSVGINNLSEEPYFKLFPNPTEYNLTITTDESIRQVDIIDCSGRVILSRKFNQSKASLPVLGFSKGVYICRIYLLDGLVNRLVTIE